MISWVQRPSSAAAISAIRGAMLSASFRTGTTMETATSVSEAGKGTLGLVDRGDRKVLTGAYRVRRPLATLFDGPSEPTPLIENRLFRGPDRLGRSRRLCPSSQFGHDNDIHTEVHE